MFENLKNQFHNQILVRFKRFRDLRLEGVIGNSELALAATDCAAALFHFREQLPAPHRLSRSEVSSQCIDYKLIADVTNAVKHGQITRDPVDGPALLDSPADIFELGVLVEFEAAGETYSHFEAVVCVNCKDGIRRCLDEAIINVVNYWCDVLHKLGIRDQQTFDQLPFPGTVFVEKADARSISLRATRGLELKTQWQLMKFDSVVGHAIPRDLTDCEVKISILRPNIAIEIVLDADGLEESYIHKIELTDMQAREYISLTSEPDKEAFQRKVIAEHNDSIVKGFKAFVSSN